ncbi:PREDICTED: putative cysteine-rich repeat secretory protein 23 [Camelina sativa]|uniref:Cysteine-rich repeat secretory protein 23 n=1 Tax=Camelina sativa TaxID=90675 RepID=A0ABM0WB09_CAMSA|nr:PREDICTED: putative cysteine-rich repeat secretory protein 23 [Camelina sativa]
MSSSFVSKRIFSVTILAMVAMQLSCVESVLSLNQTNEYLHHICLNRQGTYKSGGKYERDLNNLIPMISISVLGNVVVFSGDNAAYVKLQCRGDSSTSKCRTCLDTAFSEIRRRCPNNRGRIIWYDNCVLTILTFYTYAEIDYQNHFYISNAKDVSGDTKSFNEKTRALLHRLMEKASSKENVPSKKNYLYATGEESLGKMRLYGMVQCTQDLSIKNCSVCLNWILAKLPKCCNGKQGGRFLSTSCNFRYELYPFVKLTTI